MTKKQHAAKYYEKHKKKIKKKVNTYYQRNRAKCIKRMKSYWKRNKVKMRKYNETLKRRFQQAKHNAKRRRLKFKITFKQYEKLVGDGCYYCKVSLLEMVGHGLDRKNNDGPYVFSNVLPCCRRCNKGRNNFFTVREWKIMINALLRSKKK